GKDKREFLAAERATVESVGAGLNALCSDGDYKAVLATITTIVYRPTDDRSVKLAAAIAGGTLTFTDYAFGSTRDTNDFEAAAQKACDAASIPPAPVAPAAPRPSPAPASKPASRAW